MEGSGAFRGRATGDGSAVTTTLKEHIVHKRRVAAAAVAMTPPEAPVLFIIGRVVSLADSIRPAQVMLYA